MFRLLLSLKLILTAAAFVTSASSAFGQDGPPPMDERRPPNGARQNLIAQLGLTPEQVQQFRRVNAEHRPLMNEAQRRMRDATRELDLAIYADDVSEELVRDKLKAFQGAIAEINRLRFANELAIRKILTREQLVRFRGWRRQIAEGRQQNQRNNVRPRRDSILPGQPVEGDPQSRPVDNKKRPTI